MYKQTRKSTNLNRCSLPAAMAIACIPMTLITACSSGFVADKDFRAFKSALGNTSVTVFPAIVRIGEDIQYDQLSASEIAKFIESEKLGTAKVAKDEIEMKRGWHGSQTKMLRESAESFSDYITAHPIETKYAVLAEYLGTKKEFGGIQCNVVSRDGKPAFALVLNSHHEVFSRIGPKSTSDCAKVLVVGMREHLASRK
jgi:hypothetical protein